MLVRCWAPACPLIDCTSLMNSTGQSPFFQKIEYKDQYNPHHPIRVDYRVKPITHNNLMLICSELFHLRWSVSKFGRKLSNCNLMLMMFFFLFFFCYHNFSLLKLSVTFLMAFFLSFFSDVFINATGRLSLFLE